MKECRYGREAAIQWDKLIEVAKRDLTEMKTLFENQLYYGALNRAYYAMFHAVSALLITDGKRYKKHSAVISAFGRDYANAGLASTEYHELLNNAFEIRNRADYDVDLMAIPFT
jgi:uncharacterized protein (UPF0332 family)